MIEPLNHGRPSPPRRSRPGAVDAWRRHRRRLHGAAAPGAGTWVDAVVFAASGPPTLALLQACPARPWPATRCKASASPLAWRCTDPAFAPAERRWWSSSIAVPTACEASMWLDPVLLYRRQPVEELDTRRSPPQQVLASADFLHGALPASIVAQRSPPSRGAAACGSRAVTRCPSIRRRRRCCRSRSPRAWAVAAPRRRLRRRRRGFSA